MSSILKGRKRPAEVMARIVATKRAKLDGKPWHSEATKKKISAAREGKKLSFEHRAKIKLNAWRGHHTQEMREHLRQVNLGRIITPQAREKLAKHYRGKTYQEIHGDKGLEIAAKIKAAHRARWKGKRKADAHPYKGCFEYEEWRKAVLARDKYTCQRCGKKNNRFDAHHIKPWATHIELRYEVTNGKTVCSSPCHKEEHREMRQQQKQLTTKI